MTDKESDFVNEQLFKRYTGKDGPLIQFGPEFEKRSMRERIRYLHKLASSLNHAAATIQGERDDLNKLLFAKERQLTQCEGKVQAAHELVHRTLANVNGEKQALLEENQGLRLEIKRLEDGNNN